MAEGADDVRHDMAVTRERMADTVAELEARVSSTVDGVKAKLDVMRWAREHPWPALAVALAAGYALATTGTDATVAGAVADGAASAAESAKDAASNVVDRVRERFAEDGGAPPATPPEPSWLDRLGARVAGEIAALLGGPASDLSRELARVGGNGAARPSHAEIDPRPLGSAGDARL